MVNSATRPGSVVRIYSFVHTKSQSVHVIFISPLLIWYYIPRQKRCTSLPLPLMLHTDPMYCVFCKYNLHRFHCPVSLAEHANMPSNNRVTDRCPCVVDGTNNVNSTKGPCLPDWTSEAQVGFVFGTQTTEFLKDLKKAGRHT